MSRFQQALVSRNLKIALVVLLLSFSMLPAPAAAGPIGEFCLITCFQGCDIGCSIFYGDDYLDCYLNCTDTCCAICGAQPGSGC